MNLRGHTRQARIRSGPITPVQEKTYPPPQTQHIDPNTHVSQYDYSDTLGSHRVPYAPHGGAQKIRHVNYSLCIYIQKKVPAKAPLSFLGRKLLTYDEYNTADDSDDYE